MLAGRIIAGPHVRAACTRHLTDIRDAQSRGLYWRPDIADRILRFFPTVLRLNGGEHEGKPFVLEPWEAFIAGSLFGWVRADGFRRFQVAYVETAKGSGKSPLSAGIGHYMFIPDGEARAEIYAAATKKDQAMVLFRDAVAMVEQSPALSSRIAKSGGNPVWNLAHLPTGSFFRPISSEDDGQSGPRPHCALIDEIHEHTKDTVVEMMRAGLKGRRQPLIFMITNSGSDRQSVCFRYHEYGVRVASSPDPLDDTFFAYICAVDEGEDPLTDKPDKTLGYPKSWAKTNPSIGVTFPVSYLEGQVREAKGMPAKESLVRRLNFCQWVDAVNPWIDGDLWRTCEVDALPAGEGPISLALDLGSKRDLVAAAKVQKRPDGKLLAELRFWTPADTLEERSRIDRVPYDAWVRSNHLRAVPGRSIDFGFVARDLSDWLGVASGLAFDQWRIEDFQRALDEVGIDNWIWDPPERKTGIGIRMVRHGQGYGGGRVELDVNGDPLPKKTLWMPRSITQLEDAVMRAQLSVLRNPCLTWNSASAVLERDPAANAKWEKRKSTGRIDGIVALSMAVGLAIADIPVPSFDIQFLGV